MAFLMKLLRNWTNLVSIIGVVLVFGIVLSGVDAMYILVVLGAMNFLYGLYALITKKSIIRSVRQMEEKDLARYNRSMGVCQMVMGIFVLAMGIIYVCQIVTGKYFWDIVLVGIVLLMVCWYVIRLRARNY